MPRLQVASFAHVADASIDFGDLTVLVGAQGTGKSLLFQWLKTAIDGKQILTALREAGQDVSQPDALVDLIFGVGMGSAWTSSTEVKFNGKSIRPRNIGKLGNGRERVFFVPAHRAMLISDGWAAHMDRGPERVHPSAARVLPPAPPAQMVEAAGHRVRRNVIIGLKPHTANNREPVRGQTAGTQMDY